MGMIEIHLPTNRYLQKLQHAAAGLRQLRLRPRLLMAFVNGVISALAFPPYNVTPLLWLCFPVLLWLAQGAKNGWQAALTGWCFAFGFMVLGLYWIAASMFVDLGHFWWAVPLAVAGLPAFFALDYAVMTALAWKIGLRGISGTILFALCWFLGDYARGHLFTGFPWIIAGYAWTPVLPMLQLTSLTGIYGLSLVTLVTACLPAALVEPSKRKGWIAVLAAVAVLAFCAAWGEGRLLEAKTSYPALTVPDARVRLVQPNIAQALKWDAAMRDSNFQHLLDLTSAPPTQGGKPVTHVIWPETASPYRLVDDTEHRLAMADRIPASGSILTGVIRLALDNDNKVHYYNSLVAVDGRGRLVAGYDKVHLVPYGEYFPFAAFLHMRAIANLGMDFDHGDDPRTLRVVGLPSFSPLICYEAIFPGAVIDRDDRPHFLLNITNDGWYGHTAGPYQHFAIVRVRAIEEGMPLLRAANTGISGVVDAYGRITARLGVGKTGFLDSDLPGTLPPTWFSRHGEKTLWIVFGLLAVAALGGRMLNRNK